MKKVMFTFFLLFVAFGSYWIFQGFGAIFEGYLFQSSLGVGWPSYAEAVPYFLVSIICFGVGTICLYLSGE